MIEIRQQYAKIGINTNRTVLALDISKAEIELNIKKPELKINSPRPRVYIDQSKCFADANRRGIREFLQYSSDMARAAVMGGIQQRVEEGDMLAAIEDGYTIEKLAEAVLDENIDFNVTAVPQQPPVITAVTEAVKIEYEPGHIELKLHRGRVINNSKAGRVNIYLRQMNKIEIRCSGKSINTIV